MTIGIVNVLASFCARGAVSRVLKVPSTPAAIYNVADIVATAGATYLVNRLLHDYTQGGIDKPDNAIRGIKAGLVAFAVSRVVGITAGVFIARAAHHPVSPLAGFTLSMSAVTGFLISSIIVVGKPLYYELV